MGSTIVPYIYLTKPTSVKCTWTESQSMLVDSIKEVVFAGLLFKSFFFLFLRTDQLLGTVGDQAWN